MFYTKNQQRNVFIIEFYHAQIVVENILKSLQIKKSIVRWLTAGAFFSTALFNVKKIVIK